ncbi:MAG TPA: hypothetical protein VK956_18930, partial [Verrucomicrobium sp.]|nr:hypothetical protein [Verrucomicrobium sp.]
SNGEQTFTFFATNGATALVFGASDLTAGSLTTMSGFGTTTLTGDAGVFDAEGASSSGNPLRVVNFHLDSPVTSIQFHFTSEVFGGLLLGDNIDLRDFSFTPVPEPSGALLCSFAAMLGLLRRKRTVMAHS